MNLLAWMRMGHRQGRTMDDETADAMATRLLKAFFDVRGRDKAQRAAPHVPTNHADALSEEPQTGVEVPPAP